MSLTARCLPQNPLPTPSYTMGPWTVKGRPLCATALALAASTSECDPQEQISANEAISAMRSSASASGSRAYAPVDMPMSESSNTRHLGHSLPVTGAFAPRALPAAAQRGWRR